MSLKEPSWMSLYKGLVAYLVYLYLESLGIVRRVINARSENRSSGIADLEQILIYFISENDCSASALVIGSV